MTDKYELAIMDLCYALDEDVYLPVKEELAGCGRTYSLGVKKEIFKGKIEETINKLKGNEITFQEWRDKNIDFLVQVSIELQDLPKGDTERLKKLSDFAEVVFSNARNESPEDSADENGGQDGK